MQLNAFWRAGVSRYFASSRVTARNSVQEILFFSKRALSVFALEVAATRVPTVMDQTSCEISFSSLKRFCSCSLSMTSLMSLAERNPLFYLSMSAKMSFGVRFSLFSICLTTIQSTSLLNPVNCLNANSRSITNCWDPRLSLGSAIIPRVFFRSRLNQECCIAAGKVTLFSGFTTSIAPIKSRASFDTNFHPEALNQKRPSSILFISQNGSSAHSNANIIHPFGSKKESILWPVIRS